MLSRLISLNIVILLSCCCIKSTAQHVSLSQTSSKNSLRGLSVVNDRVIWVSGSNGTVGRSVDSGQTFQFIPVPGFEKIDFRDIEAFNEMEAVIMGIAEPAYILRTDDGGKTWRVVYENKTSGMFLDAMDFYDDQHGMVIGDPLDGKFFIAQTSDGGTTWRDVEDNMRPLADSGEACFASSGTNIRMIKKNKALFVTGGTKSSLIKGNQKKILNLIEPGKTTTGANSVAVKSNKAFVVVGGDFNQENAVAKNCLLTKNGGKSWFVPATPPHGYRSCVEYLGKKNWISCGLNGVDYSIDEGNNWQWISRQSFHVVRKAKTGACIYFAGSNGAIGKLVMP